MRQHAPNPPSLLLFFAALLPASASVTLSQFQTISGFPSACANAYNSAIPNCDTSDFSGGAPCSMQCVSALQGATNTLNSACQGTTADPNTLIGMFLSGNGVHALCPNVIVSTVVQTPTQSQAAYSSPSIQTSTSTSTTMSTSTVFVMPSLYSSTSPSSSPSSTTSSFSSTSSSCTSSTSSTAATSSSSSSASSVLSTSSQAATTTTTTSSSTSSTVTTILVHTSSASTTHRSSSSASSTTDSGNTAAFTKTAVENGSQTVIISKPEQTKSDNADNFGGGGSPFEIASSSNRKMSLNAWVVMVAAGTAAGACML